jgi:hypothetical protein
MAFMPRSGQVAIWCVLGICIGGPPLYCYLRYVICKRRQVYEQVSVDDWVARSGEAQLEDGAPGSKLVTGANAVAVADTGAGVVPPQAAASGSTQAATSGGAAGTGIPLTASAPSSSGSGAIRNGGGDTGLLPAPRVMVADPIPPTGMVAPQGSDRIYNAL